MRAEMRAAFADLRGDVKVLKWMTGLAIASIASLVVNAFVA